MADNVLIIAGEASGELYGALLTEELKRLYPEVDIYGVGGEKMEQAGVELIGTVTGAFGLIEALASLGKIKEIFQRVKSFLENRRPRVVVLIDFPEFNLKVAERAHELGIKVLYYVSPQIWAWRKKRIKKIKQVCDKMAVILPFEEKIYKDYGVDAEFVGHPIMEEIERIKGAKTYIREGLSLNAETETMALLPGSRKSELKRHLPLYFEVVRELKKRYQNMQFVLPLAQNLKEEDFLYLKMLKKLGVNVFKGKATEALMASNFALIASGTATLQAALIGVPMVVVYRLFPLTYLIGRMIVNVRFISLVNILSQREVVKELIQWEANKENVLRELDKIIKDESIRRFMLEQFGKIRKNYEGKMPSLRVAEIVGELAGWRAKGE